MKLRGLSKQSHSVVISKSVIAGCFTVFALLYENMKEALWFTTERDTVLLRIRGKRGFDRITAVLIASNTPDTAAPICEPLSLTSSSSSESTLHDEMKTMACVALAIMIVGTAVDAFLPAATFRSPIGTSAPAKVPSDQGTGVHYICMYFGLLVSPGQQMFLGFGPLVAFVT